MHENKVICLILQHTSSVYSRVSTLNQHTCDPIWESRILSHSQLVRWRTLFWILGEKKQVTYVCVGRSYVESPWITYSKSFQHKLSQLCNPTAAGSGVPGSRFQGFESCICDGQVPERLKPKMLGTIQLCHSKRVQKKRRNDDFLPLLISIYLIQAPLGWYRSILETISINGVLISNLLYPMLYAHFPVFKNDSTVLLHCHCAAGLHIHGFYPHWGFVVWSFTVHIPVYVYIYI